jgi:hypothetical protein
MPGEVIFLLGLLAGVLASSFVMLLRRRPAPATEPGHGAQAQLETTRMAAETAALTTQMADVRDRLATLERLVTDRSVLLAEEIDNLRARA